jgi:Family of unknown function (DUF6281)
MRRAIATALVLGAGLAAVPGATAAGAACPSRLSWHAASYRQLAVRGEVPLGRRLGRATLTSTCRTTHTTPRASVAGTAVRRVVYSVDGIRPSVAVAIAARRPLLFVSRRPATAAEIGVLNRIRRG